MKTVSQLELPSPDRIIIPARLSPERFRAWKWRAASLGGLVLNALLYDEDAIVNPLTTNLPETEIQRTLGESHDTWRHSDLYTMHVGSLKIARHFAGNQSDGGNSKLRRTLARRQEQAGMPQYFGPAVIMGLMEEVPTFDSEFGHNDSENATVKQPYPLSSVDKHTQELVERIAEKFGGLAPV